MSQSFRTITLTFHQAFLIWPSTASITPTSW
jgi:hypothetical protein